MEKRKRILRNQKGFTLVEIIAVLVILGILAAVAIPKFQDLQDEAKRKGASGATSAGLSALSMGYAQYLLGNTSVTPTTACGSVKTSGGTDYNVQCSGGDWSASYITVTGNYDGKTNTVDWYKP